MYLYLPSPHFLIVFFQTCSAFGRSVRERSQDLTSFISPVIIKFDNPLWFSYAEIAGFM